MIDYACVVSRGGVVLWNQHFDHGFDGHDRQPNGEGLNKLISSVLLEERGATQQASIDCVSFRWKALHSIDAVMYIMYQGIQSSQNIGNLLDTAADIFVAHVRRHHKNPSSINWITDTLGFEFDDEFSQLLYKIGLSASKPATTETTDNTPQRAANGKRDQSKKPGKTGRDWGIRQTVSKREMDALDFSTDKESRSGHKPSTAESAATPQPEAAVDPSTKGGIFRSVRKSLGRIFGRGRSDVTPKPSTDEGSNGPSVLDNFAKMVLKYAGNMVLTPEAIEEPLKELKLKLNAKNVANDISTMICDSISAGLVGKKTASLKSVAATVREALEASVRRILTPKEPINLLRNVSEANARDEVYSVLFLGVNGVGKSTSLAKVTYLLKCNGFKVLLIACDTFRSGAVEQLKIHADKLGVELFERGYGKDPSAICREGMKYARAGGFNVVLIDTAGRMQDNEPLMAALSKLIHVNNPDLLLFVGEALVGNDAVDQLRKFNQAIQRMGESSDELRGRKIDGIILTKFDTVDDKVGAALSMCYITGQPIVFVGTGQTYTNLNKLEINDVVKSLTS
ncbi:signal recognition particle receptor alpha [Babesia ovata]|uniref:Signal recognition particle receptor alpha n=1 Tax=Babesia ovata TaxID=189622 RepID=A0A2H6K7X9_9APIC|nr:signal recognition particle receptor alpha [Babesia ovata]GBE59094.1 signal recognition particle receptor alpha [Babesia ovata]